MGGITNEIQIRAARAHELEQLQQIERLAGELFSSFEGPLTLDDGEPTPLPELEAARARDDLFVAAGANGSAVGWGMLETVDGAAHLGELSVHPDHGRRGIGRTLVEHCCAIARARGYAAMTLTTFREVPWNRPFYEGAGFVEIPAAGPEMRKVIQREESWGLDFRQRCVMRREL